MPIPAPISIRTRSAFTLVEILVVIMLISIMTGILITVVDPIKQRQRAQNGTIVATADKIVQATNAYYSAFGTYPSCHDLANNGTNSELVNSSVPTTGGLTWTCTAADGTFTITGIPLPTNLCGADGYAVGGGLCGFKYGQAANGAGACIGARMQSGQDLDNDGFSKNYLYWDNTMGTFKDSSNVSPDPICNL